MLKSAPIPTPTRNALTILTGSQGQNQRQHRLSSGQAAGGCSTIHPGASTQLTTTVAAAAAAAVAGGGITVRGGSVQNTPFVTP